MDIELVKIIAPLPFVTDTVLFDSRKLRQNKTCTSCKRKDCLEFLNFNRNEYRCYKGFDNLLFEFGGERLIFNGIILSNNSTIPSGRKESRKEFIFSRVQVESLLQEFSDLLTYINKGITESVREKFSLFHDVKTAYGLAFSNIESYIFKQRGGSFNDKLQNCEQEIIDLYDSLDLVNSLLNLIDVTVNPTAITQGTKRDINLFRLMDKLRKLFQVTAHRNNNPIRIFSTFQVNNGSYHESIKLVPIILYDNAIKYSDSNQEIHVTFTDVSPKIKFNVMSYGELIPEAEREKIFIKHYRGKNASRYTNVGVGMGLFIARLILEKHNGTITYRGIEDKGTKGYNNFEVIV